MGDEVQSVLNGGAVRSGVAAMSVKRIALVMRAAFSVLIVVIVTSFLWQSATNGVGHHPCFFVPSLGTSLVYHTWGSLSRVFAVFFRFFSENREWKNLEKLSLETLSRRFGAPVPWDKYNIPYSKENCNSHFAQSHIEFFNFLCAK